jgi:hypothetical protein
MFLQSSVGIQQNTVPRCKKNRKNSPLRFFNFRKEYILSPLSSCGRMALN